MKTTITIISLLLLITTIVALGCGFLSNCHKIRFKELLVVMENGEEVRTKYYTEIINVTPAGLKSLELDNYLYSDSGRIYLSIETRTTNDTFRIYKFDFNIIEKTGAFEDLEENYYIKVLDAEGKAVTNAAYLDNLDYKEDSFSNNTNLVYVFYRIALAYKGYSDVYDGDTLTVKIDLEYEMDGKMWELKKTERMIVRRRVE